MKKIVKDVVVLFAAFMSVMFIALASMMALKVVNYLNRGFQFDTAVQWAKEDMDMLLDINEETADDDIVVYEMTNKNIDIVACTALK